MTRGVFVVESHPTADGEAAFNEWYDGVHIPELLAVDGFVSAKRYRLLDSEDGPAYVAIYQLDTDGDLHAPLLAMREAPRTDPPEGVFAKAPKIALYEEV